MNRRLVLVVAVALLGGRACFLSGDGVDAAQAKPKKPPTYRPPTTTHAKIFRVQVRSPHWKVVAVAPNRAAAHAIRHRLHRQGWSVSLRHNRVGQVVVRARMLHWHTRARVVHPAVAQRIGAYFLAQGFQVRLQ